MCRIHMLFLQHTHVLLVRGVEPIPMEYVEGAGQAETYMLWKASASASAE